MKKKILYVITKSNWGGAQRYVYDLATNLPKEQFDVAVALGGNGALQKKLNMAGVRVIQLQNVQRDISLTTDVGGFVSIYSAIKMFQPDTVHMNSSKAGGLGALAARSARWRSKRPIKIIFTVHGWPFLEKRNVLWRLFVYLASWATVLLSHITIVVSKNDLGIGKRMPFCGSKIHLIYNGISADLPLGSGSIIRSAFPPGARITGTVGELTKNKNQIALINQTKSDTDMYVAIVGEGEDRAYLEEKIKEYGLESRVKLFGFIPASEVLRGFDVFALPSLKEGLPYVLLEAKLADLPIIANRVGGVSEILDAKDMSDFSLARMLKKTTALYPT